jgi:hypothetical protein
VHREFADVATGKKDWVNYIRVSGESEPRAAEPVPTVGVGDFEDRLVFEHVQKRVSEVFEKETLDQLVHGFAAAAVRKRDLSVSNLSLPAPRSLDSFEQRRW